MRLFKSKEKLSESESVYLADIEQKIKAYKAKGYRVPTRKMIKTAAQIKGIRRSAAINTAVLDLVAAHIHEGMTTEEIDTLVYNFTIAHGAIPAPLNYEGFPKSVCTSVNDEVCHGIPSKDVVLRNGDIINVDVSTILDGYFSDASRMFMIGKVSPEMQRLVQVARECLEAGLQAARPWGFLGDIGAAVQEHAEGNGVLLVPGMVFTIEPMINMGSRKIFIDADNDWTVLTDDGMPSAQWEYTVLITDTGAEIITG